LADADLLPFDFTALADTVQMYVKELGTLLKDRQDAVKERNRRIEDGVFAAVDDPRRPKQPPALEQVPPAINFAPLENAANALTRAADRYRKAVEAARPKLRDHANVVTAVNARLRQSERQLTDRDG